jgi:hypothetical protein
METRLIQVHIDKQLKKDFQLKCYEDDKNMKEVIIELISKYINNKDIEK